MPRLYPPFVLLKFLTFRFCFCNGNYTKKPHQKQLKICMEKTCCSTVVQSTAHVKRQIKVLRAFLSNLSNAKNLIFLAFLTQKLAPSNVLNGIIFAIDEKCNLIFETALFTNCKPYIIFLFSGAH